MIVVNFKRYLDVGGAVQLCKVCKWIGEETGLRIIAAVDVSHLPLCLSTGVECWTQRFEPGARGYAGSLLNHSDYRLGWAQIHDQAEELMTHGREACICAATAAEATEVSTFNPNYVAFEPPSLIGSRDKSVASERPQEVAKVVKALAPLPVLIGAGIHSAQDIKAGLELGAKGFLIATDVVKAKDPGKELRELAKATRQ